MNTNTPDALQSFRRAYAGDVFNAELAAQAIAASLEHADTTALREWLGWALAADVADALDRLEPARLAAALRLIPVDEQARMFGYLPLRRQTHLVAGMSRSAVIERLGRMSSDERADLFNTLPEGREALLPALAQAQRDDIRRLASYERGSVGAIMNSQYATLTPQLTAAEAVDELRRIAPDSETIYNAYIIDEQRRLIGVTTLRRLILAPPNTRLADMMEAHPVCAHVHDVHRIVTADDAMDVMEAEATEDFHKSGGSLGRWPLRMKDATIRLLYRKRVFWLVLLVFANIFSGAGIAYFEDLIAANVALVFFLPLLIDSGGNAGSQSATLMVRALATGDVQLRD